ncbi:MAG: PrsW family glutamic-type intramembrane protease [Acetobacteraceae bacterium]|nr:PrsW family intramembrane metalloprotease [Pseudomonadota bacterium]
MLAPVALFAGLCAAVHDVGRRTQVLSLAVGLAACATIFWGAVPFLLRVLPFRPFQAPATMALVYAAVPEEIVRFLALLLLWHWTQPRSGRDVLVLTTGIACGFAAFEGALGIWFAAHPWAMLAERLMVGLPVHVALAAIVAAIAAPLGRMPDRRYLIPAWIAAVLAHWLFDAIWFADWRGMAYGLVTLYAAFAGFAWWRASATTSGSAGRRQP